MVTQASRLWPELAKRLKIPLQPIGGLLLALDSEQAAQLPKLRAKGVANGINDLEILSASEVRALEPNAAPTACGGLLVPRESIVDPFSVPIAFAELAITNSVDLVLGFSVIDIQDQ